MPSLGLLFIFLTTVSPNMTTAANKDLGVCPALMVGFSREIIQLSEVECKQNPYYRNAKRSTALQPATYVEVDPDSVIVRVARRKPVSLDDLIYGQNGKVHWYKNARNVPLWHDSYDRIPHFSETPAGFIAALLSASRSNFVNSHGDAYSLKTPSVVDGLGKDSLMNEMQTAMIRTEVIQRIDERIGPDPELIMLMEVATVQNKYPDKNGRRNGFSLRDLRALQDGHVTMPGFAINKKFMGYMKQSGVNQEKFVSDHYIKLFARSLAKVLLRYGLTIKFPHDQNYLFRFDEKSGAPLDQIAWRDLADMYFVTDLLEPLGLSDLKPAIDSDPYELSEKTIQLYHSSYHKPNFDFFRDLKFADRQYVTDQIEIEFARYIFETLNHPYQATDLNENAVDRFLRFSPGSEALRSYHERLEREYSAEKSARGGRS
jgi:hypothetical protein